MPGGPRAGLTSPGHFLGKRFMSRRCFRKPLGNATVWQKGLSAWLRPATHEWAGPQFGKPGWGLPHPGSEALRSQSCTLTPGRFIEIGSDFRGAPFGHLEPQRLHRELGSCEPPWPARISWAGRCRRSCQGEHEVKARTTARQRGGYLHASPTETEKREGERE